MYPSLSVRDEEIRFGASLSPIALRNLFDHSAVHLSVEWRDLLHTGWANEVKTIQGRTVPASETVWMRTREVWIHAVDLDNGASFKDIPAPVLERLLLDITSAWKARGADAGLHVRVTDRPEVMVFGDAAAEPAVEVSGPLSAWSSGRPGVAVQMLGPLAGQRIPKDPRRRPGRHEKSCR